VKKIPKGTDMSAPSKANIGKLDNPARVRANHRHGTGGNPQVRFCGGHAPYNIKFN